MSRRSRCGESAPSASEDGGVGPEAAGAAGQHVEQCGGLAVGERGDVVDHRAPAGGRGGAELAPGELDEVVQARREARAVAVFREVRADRLDDVLSSIRGDFAAGAL